MTRTLVVGCDAIPTLDPDQMRRLALAVLMDEDAVTDEVRTFVHGPDGIDRYVTALQKVSADIADQRAAFNGGRFTPKGDAIEWQSKSGRLKERIDRALPDLRALQAEHKRVANGGDVGRRYRALVAAVEAHRDALAALDPGYGAMMRVANVALWDELNRITAKTPAADTAV